MVVRFIKSLNDQTSSIDHIGSCQKKFDNNTIIKEIQIDELLPPNSMIYAVSLCPTSIMDVEDFENNLTTVSQPQIQYSLDKDDSANQYFQIDTFSGIIIFKQI